MVYYDFHCLMNNEIIYLHSPGHVGIGKFEKLSEEVLRKIDHLAILMQNPDKNFEQLVDIWENRKDVRLLSGALL